MTNQGERINRITAKFEGNGVSMTGYRTHKKLITVHNTDIGIEDYKDDKTTNKPAYLEYCRSILINLLQNGGIQGYYYDPTNYSQQEQAGMPKKFTDNSFTTYAGEIVQDKLHTVTDGMTNISYEVNDVHSPEVTEYYSDGNIKYGRTMVLADIINEATNARVRTLIPVQIKSGQLSKPAVIMAVDGNRKGIELSLSATTLNSFFNDKPRVNTPAPEIDKDKVTEVVQAHAPAVIEAPKSTQEAKPDPNLDPNMSNLIDMLNTNQ